jgi:hypothetical protein
VLHRVYLTCRITHPASRVGELIRTKDRTG